LGRRDGKKWSNYLRGVSVRRRDRRVVVVNLDFGAKQHHDGTTNTTIHQSARAQFRARSESDRLQRKVSDASGLQSLAHCPKHARRCSLNCPRGSNPLADFVCDSRICRNGTLQTPDFRRLEAVFAEFVDFTT
jgi:hypothetical protein